MKKTFLSLAAIACCLGLQAQVNGTIMADTNNIKVVKIWGTHEERGYAYGYLMGANITEVVNQYIKPTFSIYYSNTRTIITTGQDLAIDPLYETEARAMIRGMDDAGTNTGALDYVDLLVSNSLLDITKILGSSLEVGCSSLISWGDATAGTGLDGRAVLSRHLDWLINPYLNKNQVLCINLPSEPGEQPWASIGFAGMFSVLSGFNQNLGVFQHMMDDYTGRTYSGKHFEPIWFSLRRAVEQADYNADGRNNVNDLRSVLSDHSQGYADGYLISAMARSEEEQDSLIALMAELAPASPYITFRSNSFADSIPGDNLYTANYQIARNNRMHLCTRYNAVKSALGSGTGIGIDESWEVMRDYSHLANNIQFMQYAPEAGLLKLSVYDNQTAYTQEPVTFNISELFSANSGIGERLISHQVISCYPNPVAGTLTLTGLDPAGGPVRLHLSDIRGQLILVRILEQKAGTCELDLDVLPPGMYLLQVMDSGSLQRLKVVKQ